MKNIIIVSIIAFLVGAFVGHDLTWDYVCGQLLEDHHNDLARLTQDMNDFLSETESDSVQ